MDGDDLVYFRRPVYSIKQNQVWLYHPNFQRPATETVRLSVRLSEPERLLMHSFIGRPPVVMHHLPMAQVTGNQQSSGVFRPLQQVFNASKRLFHL